jgi:hypothetical protein
MQNSEAIRGVVALTRKVGPLMKLMAARTEAHEGGRVLEVLSNDIRQMGVPIKPGKIRLRKKSIPNRMICNLLTTFTGQMF